MNVWMGVLLPFMGTTLGAACVFFMKKELNARLEKALLGFAAGVMVAASVWSLLLPSIAMEQGMGKLAFVPAAVGVLSGMAFLLLMDKLIPHLHLGAQDPEGLPSHLKKTTMLVLAVTLHNIPEGMAVGVAFAGFLAGNGRISLMAAFALSIGIAIQNFPEGSIISMPLRLEGQSRMKAFLCGTLSGVVEPVAAGITIAAAHVLTPILPYVLSFAAGAMLYVVVEELIPEASLGKHSDIGTIGFGIGFVLMMVLDVSLG